VDEKLVEFVEDFHSEVLARADANDTEKEEAFTETMCDHLVQFGEIDDYQLCSWLNKNIGARIDAYQPDDDMETVSLVVNVWKSWNGAELADWKVSNRDIDAAVKRATTFASRALIGKLPGDRIDSAHPAYDLAILLRDLKEGLTKLRIIVVTDGIAPQREGTTLDVCGIDTVVVVWDMNRVFNRRRSGEREGIIIDFADYGGAVPCVSSKSENGFYTTYLAFVSGAMLADLYEHHKTRLLEMNVRVFLSQRVSVNKGIRDTIRNEPGMFGAYNNGITVYAESLETTFLDDGSLALSIVDDFQIVNGGQTTASLYHTRKAYKSNLDDVFVQMKIMVIHESAKPEDMNESTRLSDLLVPKIGKFSNSQNRVQMSDLRANDPPHPVLHNLSLKLPAPDPTGGTRESYWFYEKARGSWDERRRLDAKTTAQRKLFDAKYPRQQRFEKGIFSKVWYAHHEKPHIVSLGPQKCFAAFNSNLLAEEVKISADTPDYWAGYFKRTVGLLIVWGRLEKEVKRRIREQIYQSFAQNLVGYTLALLSNTTNQKLDLEAIWNAQDVPDELLHYLLELCDLVHKHIVDTPSGVTHVPEWCKQEDCWKTLLEHPKLPVPSTLDELFSSEKKGAKPKRSDEDAAVEFCVSKGEDAWKALSKFLKERDLMGGKQRSQAFNMGRAIGNNKIPSTKLAIPCRKIWENAELMYNWEV